MAVKNYAVTEFRFDFEPSSNQNEKLAVITCKLLNSNDSVWILEIKQFTCEEEKNFRYTKRRRQSEMPLFRNTMRLKKFSAIYMVKELRYSRREP